MTTGTCQFEAAKCWYSHEYSLVQAAVCQRKQSGVISTENKKAATDANCESFVEPSGKGGRGKGKGSGGKGFRGGKRGRGENANGGGARNLGGKSTPATEARNGASANAVQVDQTINVTAAQVVVTAQVEGEEFDPLENFVGSTYMSDEAKELSNDSEVRGKHGITALVLDTAAATSIMSCGVLQDLKRLRKNVRVSPYAGEAIAIDQKGVFFGIDNCGFMLLVPGILAMQGDCLNLLSWSQLSRLGYELRGEGNKLSLFDDSQKCCGQFLRCEGARGRKYRGLFVLNMATVPLTSCMGQDPWVKQRKTQWEKAMRSPACEGQRVWANVVRCGVDNESELEADVSSISEEKGDEAYASSLDECEHGGDGTTAPKNELSVDVQAKGEVAPETEGGFAKKDTHDEPAAEEPLEVGAEVRDMEEAKSPVFLEESPDEDCSGVERAVEKDLGGTDAANQFDTVDSAKGSARTGAKRADKSVESETGEAQATKMPDEGSPSLLLGAGDVRTTGVTSGESLSLLGSVVEHVTQVGRVNVV